LPGKFCRTGRRKAMPKPISVSTKMDKKQLYASVMAFVLISKDDPDLDRPNGDQTIKIMEGMRTTQSSLWRKIDAVLSAIDALDTYLNR
jgi:hypothetical protein